MLLVGFRRWARQLDEKQIERGADAYRKRHVPPLRVRLIAAATAAVIGLALHLVGVPRIAVLVLIAFAPAVLQIWWRQTRL